VIAQRVLVLALLSFVLAACGGGGGGGGTGATAPNQPPSPPPTTPPGGNPPPTNPPPTSGPDGEELGAQNAKLRIYQDDDALVIYWEDTFDNERGYQLQRRGDDGQWQAVGAIVPARNGGLLESLPVISTAGTYRFVALFENEVLPLHSASNETEFAIDPGPSPMTITVDQSEPVRGDVQVSVQNAGPALSVIYQLDGIPVAESSSGGTFDATLPAQRLIDGPRTLTAIVQKTAGLWIFIDRPLQIDNPNPALAMTANSSRFTPGAPIVLNARATARGGIASIAFFANDNPVAVVTTTDTRGRYVADIPRAALPSGSNVFRAVATDNYGATVSMEQSFLIDHYPSLDVAGLVDGMIAANGRVDVQATFADDMPGATLTILVGEQRLVQTQTSPLNASYSLAGVAPGTYPLLVRVRDTTGKVDVRTYQLIVPATGLGYELAATDAEQLLATDQGSILYKNRSGVLVLRDATGAETRFPAPSAGFAQYWILEDRIVAMGHDRVFYRLDENGMPLLVSAPDGFPMVYETRVSGPWLSWSLSSSFRLYNARTGVQRNVPLDSSVSLVRGYDLDLTPGAERLLLLATVNGVPGIYSLDIDTGTTQLLFSGDVSKLHTDGAVMSWVRGPSSYGTLLIAPVSDPLASTELGTNTLTSQLENGILYWKDRDLVPRVYDGSTTTQLTGFAMTDHDLLQDGRILFRNDSQMLMWSASTGERVWLDAVAQEAIQADGVAFFRTGASGTLYRVSLP